MKYLLCKCEMFASRTWANFISHRTKWDISQYATAYYFTFCDSKTFHLCDTTRQYTIGHNTLYLAGKTCEKEYEQICSYSFYFFLRSKPALWKVPHTALFSFRASPVQGEVVRLRAGGVVKTIPHRPWRSSLCTREPFFYEKSKNCLKLCFSYCKTRILVV